MLVAIWMNWVLSPKSMFGPPPRATPPAPVATRVGIPLPACVPPQSAVSAIGTLRSSAASRVRSAAARSSTAT
jgi:hypothetical protein